MMSSRVGSHRRSTRDPGRIELTHARLADVALKVFADDLVILAHDLADLGGNLCKRFCRARVSTEKKKKGEEASGTCLL
jgi:hypothetical protein